MANRLLLIFMSLLTLSLFSFADGGNVFDRDEQQLEVSMRMIGHEVLLGLGDSSSLVLPIEKNGDQYLIRFNTEFGFLPDSLATIIDGVITERQISEHYVVAFVSCNSEEIVNSYEVESDRSVLACRGRPLDVGCYEILITLLDAPMVIEMDTIKSGSDESNSQNTPYWVIGALLILALVTAFMFNKRSKQNTDTALVEIGDYTFDKRRMELHYRDEKIELTSKECQLLELLYDSVNDTVERNTILKMVWDDEGDYVGRTLDVFISKLRKKLEADSSIKIANIRGVGYKLIVDA